MLTPQQEKFVRLYLQGKTGKDAYLEAYGISNEATARVQASKLLKRQDIRDRLNELNEALADSDICNAREVRERLSRIARREEQEVVTLPNGTTAIKPTSIRDATKALELLAKINSMLVQKAAVDISANVLPIIIKDDM